MNNSANDSGQDSMPLPGWLRWVVRATRAFCTLLLIAMTAIITWQIIGRYFLNDTPKWSEQLSGILMVYLTLLGGALAVKENSHIALDYFYLRFSPRWQYRSRILVLLLMMMFGAIMLFYGVRMGLLVQAWTIPTLNISQSFNYWPFPIAGLLMLIFCSLQLRALFRSRQQDEAA